MINEQSVDQDSSWPTTLPAGAGIGLRGQHIPEVIQHLPDVPWFEVLADNHLAEGGLIPHQLSAVRSSYPDYVSLCRHVYCRCGSSGYEISSENKESCRAL